MKLKNIHGPFLFIRGGIGKRFVIKHTINGVIMTKFPDMSNIKPSCKQKHCRSSFKDAVTWAKKVIRDKDLKVEWTKKLTIKSTLFNAAIKYYMLKEKEVVMAEKKKEEAKWKAMNTHTTTDWTYCFEGIEIPPARKYKKTSYSKWAVRKSLIAYMDLFTGKRKYAVRRKVG